MAKGEINISQMFDYEKKSGMKHYFDEQEKYSTTPFKSLKYNFDYLRKTVKFSILQYLNFLDAFST